ncbi:hypothetical protein PpBr36_02486 [Pyricularia pennisetigena]|uniref:hypothetical protein n=1 Tax=Pyricularia pennisetigena TaxID=1578925 RepID=UPI001152F54C|nr:hypothetical protein PpBr36_02486 [Pyricularia pennisetigena]TLS30502.1 hypothetical protein PpBr36_02486 [Pyricularia pennisetigena]
MSYTEHRIISSEYPLAPLECSEPCLEWTDQMTRVLEPITTKAFNEHGEQYPYSTNSPSADPRPNDHQFDVFEYWDKPKLNGHAASQDLVLRPWAEHGAVANTILIICRDHCRVNNAAGFGCGRPCAEQSCPNVVFVADGNLCFAHASSLAMFDAKQRHRASREAVALERARDDREAAAAALFVLNAGAVDRPMPDPENYMTWYDQELDKWYCIKATERLLQAAQLILPGQPHHDPLRRSVQETAQTFLEKFTAPREPMELDSDSESEQ